MKQIKKINWKEGAGEFIGFTVSVVFLMSFLLLIFGMFMQYRAMGDLDSAVMTISHDIVSCESLEEAQDMAEEEMTWLLGDTKYMPASRMQIRVGYASGSDQEWRKGNFITVSLSAYMNSYDPITKGTREVSAMAMIERNGG